MSTKAVQIFWLAIATLFVAVIVWIVKDTLVITAISGTFTAVLGLFLGVDIATMIHKTKELLPGHYKNVNLHRYITSIFIFTLLLAETFVLSTKYEREVSSLYLCFGVGFLVVVGGLISGIEGNKIATDEGPKKI